MQLLCDRMRGHYRQGFKIWDKRVYLGGKTNHSDVALRIRKAYIHALERACKRPDTESEVEIPVTHNAQKFICCAESRGKKTIVKHCIAEYIRT